MIGRFGPRQVDCVVLCRDTKYSLPTPRSSEAPKLSDFRNAIFDQWQCHPSRGKQKFAIPIALWRRILRKWRWKTYFNEKLVRSPSLKADSTESDESLGDGRVRWTVFHYSDTAVSERSRSWRPRPSVCLVRIIGPHQWSSNRINRRCECARFLQKHTDTQTPCPHDTWSETVLLVIIAGRMFFACLTAHFADVLLVA